MNYYFEAVRTWQQNDKNLKKFSYLCAMVDGRETASLAEDCGVSVDTIEQYRNAWRLYYMMGGEESDPARKLWESASIMLWKKAAQFWGRLDLSIETITDYLETGNEHNMTREQFSAHIDEKENDTPKWIRRLQHAIKFLRPSRNDYKSEMPPHVQKRYDEAVEVFVNELQQIAALADEVKE